MDLNFYEQLKGKVDGKLVEAFNSSKKKLAHLQKREMDANGSLVSLKKQKEHLTSLRSDSIGDSMSAFDKFTISLKKINSQIEAISEAIDTLSGNIIPESKKEVRRAEGELLSCIRGLIAGQAKLVEAEMNGLLIQLLALEDCHYNSVKAIYSDYGVNPPWVEPMIRPHPKVKGVDVDFEPRRSVWTLAEEAEKVVVPETIEPVASEQVTMLTGETDVEKQAKKRLLDKE